jgi:hypothetical protein
MNLNIRCRIPVITLPAVNWQDNELIVLYEVYLDRLIIAQLINNFSDYTEPEVHYSDKKNWSLGKSEGKTIGIEERIILKFILKGNRV